MELVRAFREQARACANLGSPMYAELLERCADDIERGGAVATVLAGHEDDPGPSALALRLLGSVHRLVLERRAGELSTFYPSVGGTWDAGAGWKAFERLVSAHPDDVRAWLDRPPQTNEVGRAGALVGGLLQLRRRLPVRLFEIGASGGLNLLGDRFAYLDDAGRTFGDPRSAVQLQDAWRGRALQPWPALQVVERLGCDVMPVDVRTTEGRLTLTAYVWPDQRARLERLRGALDLAQRWPVEVRRTDAVTFTEGLVLRPGAVTVLWHSVMWQYLARDEQAAVTAAVDRLGTEATDAAPFAHLSMEPMRRTPDSEREFLVVLTEWPGGERRVLGASRAHGLPTDWD